jgi:hypothetical protein
MVWPLRNDYDLWRREVGIGVHGHPLKRYDSTDRDESGQHQDQKPLSQRGLDYSVDHSVVGTASLPEVFVTFLERCSKPRDTASAAAS